MKKLTGYTTQAGFTLVETIVVLAIIGLLAGATFMLVGQDRGGKFDRQVQTTLAELRNLKSQSQTVDTNQEYGMCFTSSSWKTFSKDPASTADPCASGTSGQIKTYQFNNLTLAATVTPSDNKIIFDRLTGKPKNGASATLTFVMASPSRTQVIKVDPSGVLYVQ